MKKNDSPNVARAKQILAEEAERTLPNGGPEAAQTPPPAPEALLDLALKLKKEKKFGFARRLLSIASKDPRIDATVAHPAGDPDVALRTKIFEQHANCTYKDPDLPIEQALDDALKILRNINLEATTSQETLGIAGAIYKRKWESDSQLQNLERSFAYYKRGFDLGPGVDDGYTGINAAYVLDLLAEQDRQVAEDVGTSSESVAAKQQLADFIRYAIISALEIKAQRFREEAAAAATSGEGAAGAAKNDPEKSWWFLVTLGEAYFGLKKYADAARWLKIAAELPSHDEWEYESTARQLASIARLHSGPSGNALNAEAWQTLRAFLGNDVNAVQSAFIGKVGLALSGGGFRASLYHIGVLAKLAELDVLRSVEVLSCVSGGSIIGAHYYLEVRNLLQTKHDRDESHTDCKDCITQDDYIDIVKRIERDFLTGVQRNIRIRVMAEWRTNVQMAIFQNYSRTERAGELYEREIYKLVNDGEGNTDRYINNLKIKPFGENDDFSPRADNWRRSAKVPILIINATTLNTGHNWQFTATWMGEPPTSINTEVDGNDRLRRLYYENQAPEPFNNIRLGHAVAASACVPGLFEPLVLDGLYPDRIVRLVDGGVHDNQGIGGLLGEDCNMLLVSDASGQMSSQNNPSSGMLGVPLRSNSILMARVREAEHRELAARRRSSLVRGLMFIHLKKDLDVKTVNWRDIRPEDLYNEIDQNEAVARLDEPTSYGIRRNLQEYLAAIRTDLDSFCDKEAYALMLSGYRMAGHEFTNCIRYEDFRATPKVRTDWRFLRIAKAVDAAPESQENKSLVRVLNTARLRAFKVWILYKPLWFVAAVIGVAALVGLYKGVMKLWSLGYESWGRGAFWTLVALLAFLLVSLLLKAVNYRKNFGEIVMGLIMAVPGFIIARIHLHLFDGRYLTVGRVHDDKASADKQPVLPLPPQPSQPGATR